MTNAATITRDDLQTYAEKIVASKKFLEKYGIDTEGMEDAEVITIINKISNAKQEAVQVLSRGTTLDSMKSILAKYVPEGFVGEFKGDNDLDVSRAQALGWVVCFDEQAKKNTPTAASDGKIRLGDLILMMQPIESYIGNRLAKEERLRVRKKSRVAKNRAKDETQGRSDMLPVFSLDEIQSSGDEE